MPTLKLTLDQGYIDAADTMADAAGYTSGIELITSYVTNFLRTQYSHVIPEALTKAKADLDAANDAYNTALKSTLNVTIE